ncbi:MAG: MBL fold metallo-hydrolase [Hyphomonadaceae bacterium]
MKYLVRTAIVLAALTGLFAIVACTVWRPIGNITIQPLSLDPMTPIASEVAAGDLHITAYVTGWVEAPANILIDQKATSLPDDLREPQWVPSIAYAVRHSRYGIAILDAGLRAGDCDYGLRPIYWVPCRNSPGSDLVSQLKTANVQPRDIRYIIPSHFHGDHISGLGALLEFTDAPLLVMEDALREIQSPFRFASGISPEMLKENMKVSMIDPLLEETPLLGQALDLFDDGSLMVFPTGGHSHGHLSALARTGDNTTLLTFDASHLAANMELGVPSGAVASVDEANDSLAQLQRLAENYERLQIIYGHEPTQWNCVEAVVVVQQLSDLCAPAPDADDNNNP